MSALLERIGALPDDQRRLLRENWPVGVPSLKSGHLDAEQLAAVEALIVAAENAANDVAPPPEPEPGAGQPVNSQGEPTFPRPTVSQGATLRRLHAGLREIDVDYSDDDDFRHALVATVTGGTYDRDHRLTSEDVDAILDMAVKVSTGLARFEFDADGVCHVVVEPDELPQIAAPVDLPSIDTVEVTATVGGLTYVGSLRMVVQ